MRRRGRKSRYIHKNIRRFVREGYRTWEEQQAIMDERIEEYVA